MLNYKSLIKFVQLQSLILKYIIQLEKTKIVQSQNLKMDIQKTQQTQENVSNAFQNLQNQFIPTTQQKLAHLLNRHQSMQNRPSNESFLSIGRMSIQEPNFDENQKISLQSNISSKARQQYQNNDLFQNLANLQLLNRQSLGHSQLFMRDQNSIKQNNQLIILQNDNEYQNLSTIHYPVKESIQKVTYSNSSQFKQRNSEGTNLSHPLSSSHHNQSETTIVTKYIYQQQKRDPPLLQQKQQPIKVTSCKCPRSKCLLMYCQCFSKGILCGKDCHCFQCRNNLDFQDKRQNARRIVLERDPNAFSNKLEIVGGEQSSDLAYKRGCNCKKTNCFKKYCQCFYAGVKCTYLCKCENCMNGGENTYKS